MTREYHEIPCPRCGHPMRANALLTGWNCRLENGFSCLGEDHNEAYENGLIALGEPSVNFFGDNEYPVEVCIVRGPRGVRDIVVFAHPKVYDEQVLTLIREARESGRWVISDGDV